MSAEVKAADHVALLHEMASFTAHRLDRAYPQIKALPSAKARSAFLARFMELTTVISFIGVENGKVKA